jgi:hypothetical protein
MLYQYKKTIFRAKKDYRNIFVSAEERKLHSSTFSIKICSQLKYKMKPKIALCDKIY